MLSKSKFTRGINCQKSLWLYYHKKEEQLFDDNTLAVFARGTDVGELATQFFPNGKMAMLEAFPGYASAKRTRELILQGAETIYEATFIFDNTLVAVDILSKINNEWYLIEMKSTNGVKPQHIKDVAVQYYVVSGSGLKVMDACVMHMNKDYIRKGDLDIKNLFVYESVLTEVMELQDFVKSNILELSKLEKLEEEPQIEMGQQCVSPYTCDFTNYCQKLIPPKIIETSILSNEPIINSAPIKSFLRNIPYPLYFFDFETIMPCVPMFDDSRPYQQIPFQYSLHYLSDKNSELQHYEYLANTDYDPRKDLIEQLIANTKNPGWILVYNIAFERSRLIEMQRDFPEYADSLEQIILRLVDLMPVFREGHYVTESMEGSYSIKYVLPALCPEMSYASLDINNGGDASSAFLSLYGETDSTIIARTRADLLNYCKMDTLAMVMILKKLEQV